MAQVDYEEAVKDAVTTEPRPGPREEHREGPVARSIEQQTAKLPSDLFLWAALGFDWNVAVFSVHRRREESEFRGSLGAHILDAWHLQQDGEAARIGRRLDRRSSLTSGQRRALSSYLPLFSCDRLCFSELLI